MENNQMTKGNGSNLIQIKNLKTTRPFSQKAKNSLGLNERVVFYLTNCRKTTNSRLVHTP